MPTNDEPLGITGAIFFTCRIPLLSPDHQCQSTKGVGRIFRCLAEKKNVDSWSAKKCQFTDRLPVTILTGIGIKYRFRYRYRYRRYFLQVSLTSLDSVVRTRAMS